MTAQIIDGKSYAEGLRGRIAGHVARLKAEHGITPGLAVVIVGHDPASQIYVSNKAKQNVEVGMYSEKYELPETAPEAEVLALIDKLNAAQKIPDAASREEAIKSARASMPPSPRRVFVGKNTDQSAAIMLADGSGKPRINVQVDADGEARIEFLDANGKVTQRIPAR